MKTPTFDLLLSGGPHPEHADKLMLYGRFVGHWVTETTTWEPDGTVVSSNWEVEFRWVLEGRAIQDVWLTPPRHLRTERAALDPRSRYGTTIRVYDPDGDVWHIHWISPRTGRGMRMTGKAEGNDIVQHAHTADVKTRWRFTDITADTFTWESAESLDGGENWAVDEVMRARRSVPPTGTAVGS